MSLECGLDVVNVIFHGAFALEQSGGRDSVEIYFGAESFSIGDYEVLLSHESLASGIGSNHLNLGHFSSSGLL